MTVWVISRIPVKGHDGNKLSMWDSETGLARFGFDIGYVKSQKEAEKMLEYYRRYASMWYNYKMQKVDPIVKNTNKNKK